jgi:phosphoglycerate dehydrogenase-like enzyme
MIGAAQIAQCRDGAFLVNVARGNVVDRTALSDALRTGKLAGAGIDVTDPEPLQPDDPLWAIPNLIITPHVSGFSGAAGHQRLAEFVAGNLARFVAGEPPAYQIEIQVGMR